MRTRWFSKLPAILCILLLIAVAVPFTGGCTTAMEYNIGLTQLVTHPAMEAARNGFIDALEDAGYVEGENVEYDFQNPEGDPTAEQTIAQKFVDDEVDLIYSFGTSISQQCINAAEGTGIPVLFCAVTDPVAAQLVASWDHPGENVTGTSDMIEMDSTVDLILDIVPGVETIGTIYNSGEVNSQVLVADLNEVCDALDIEVVEATVSTSADVLTAAQSLVGQVDVIWVGTDNTVVSALESVLGVCEENLIPFFAADDPSIEKGGIACLGFDYYDVGYQTGEMAVRILEGESAEDIPVELGETFSYTVNTAAAELYGLTIPQDILDKAMTIYDELAP
ncbi:MAG: ABC transporter substrate-binding protein [Dehalococcoidales bacterium]|nr:MAG: ABC transporter substrate-binding protein [Dehalococcoidales bacterium]